MTRIDQIKHHISLGSEKYTLIKQLFFLLHTYEDDNTTPCSVLQISGCLSRGFRAKTKKMGVKIPSLEMKITLH